MLKAKKSSRRRKPEASEKPVVDVRFITAKIGDEALIVTGSVTKESYQSEPVGQTILDIYSPTDTSYESARILDKM